MLGFEIALVTVLAMLLLIYFGMYVPVVLALLSFLGVYFIRGNFDVATNMLVLSASKAIADFLFGVIPLFVLMGLLVGAADLARDTYQVANAGFRRLRGGLGIATIVACGGFAAICGSSVATAATFSKVAYPEMRAHGYPQSFSTGVIAAGGSLGIMIPPSTVFAVYGLITEQDIGKLFIAGVVPGILAVAMYVATINIIGLVRPGFLPSTPRHSWTERFTALRDVWAVSLLFLFIIGGIYAGMFTATEAAGMGAAGAFIIAVARQKLSREDFLRALVESLRTTAAVFTILIGALIFGYFLTITQTPQKITHFLTDLGLGPYGVLSLIMVMYLFLGCIMDAMAMIILTIPIVFPVIKELGFDPIWFGVIVVMTVELGLIHPPVGMNVFVIKSVIKDVKLSTVFYGVMPFVMTDILRLAILIAFPVLALWLPSHM